MDRQPSGLTFRARFFFPLGGMWLPHLNLIHFFCEMETQKNIQVKELLWLLSNLIYERFRAQDLGSVGENVRAVLGMVQFMGSKTF